VRPTTNNVNFMRFFIYFSLQKYRKKLPLPIELSKINRLWTKRL